MRNATLVYLTKRSNGKIQEICLAMKKRGFGAGKWNGVGGKVNENESITQAATREAKEEIDVEIREMKKIAEIDFDFPHNAAWDQTVHVFFCENWEGEPKESEEMAPKWFKIDQISYADLWPDDKYWFPLVLDGKIIKAKFTFGEGDIVKSHSIKEVEKLGE